MRHLVTAAIDDRRPRRKGVRGRIKCVVSHRVCSWGGMAGMPDGKWESWAEQGALPCSARRSRACGCYMRSERLSLDCNSDKQKACRSDSIRSEAARVRFLTADPVYPADASSELHGWLHPLVNTLLPAAAPAKATSKRSLVTSLPSQPTKLPCYSCGGPARPPVMMRCGASVQRTARTTASRDRLGWLLFCHPLKRA
jgi:hypothetical protein